MRAAALLLAAATLALGACGKQDTQADALDNAAAQADPAAANAMHEEADAIRANGSDGANLSDPNGAAQGAMANAGAAAANSSAAPGQTGAK